MLESKIKNNHGDTMIGLQDRNQRHVFKEEVFAFLKG
jgi:hypothetical protein